MEEPVRKDLIQAGLENLGATMEEPLQLAETDRVQVLLTVQILAQVQLIHWNSGWMQVLLSVLAQLGLIVVATGITRQRMDRPR